ncbi:hypothetical protein [Martelella sp. HB161492]|uniref:hypothetical protein n=1 Tax=Martelella sp. HB161492 TaxID=2720726 RepID=UPI001590A92A|nr:hypothetical protein [Martelella sp. HB161492]
MIDSQEIDQINELDNVETVGEIPNSLIVNSSFFVSPPRYRSFPDRQHGNFLYTDIILRIEEDDTCTLTFIAKQLAKFYTCSRNRTHWFGPHIYITLKDDHGVPIADRWGVVQVNRGACEQRDSRYTKSKVINGAYTLAVITSHSASDYRLTVC